MKPDIIRSLVAAFVFGITLGCTEQKAADIESTWAISWSFADAGGTSTLNKSASQEAAYPALTTFNSTLYAA